MQKILVTGAAGFIGSHVAKELLNRGNEVVCLDNFSDYYSPEYKKLRVNELLKSYKLKIHQVDLSDAKQTFAALDKFQPEGVIHLAAQPGVRLPINKFNKYVDSNIVSFNNLLVGLAEREIKTLTYASSSSVYGDISPLPYKETSELLGPTSYYGATKLLNEQTTRIFSRSGKIVTRGLRYFTVYGAWGRPDMAYFRLIASALGKSEFRLFGDGTIRRDFTFIDDIVNATIDLHLDLKARQSGFCDVVNIGGNRPLSMNYLIDCVKNLSSRKLVINKIESNKSDMKSIIGKRQFTSLETGIEKIFEWMSTDSISRELENWIRSTV